MTVQPNEALSGLINGFVLLVITWLVADLVTTYWPIVALASLAASCWAGNHRLGFFRVLFHKLRDRRTCGANLAGPNDRQAKAAYLILTQLSMGCQGVLE